MKNLWLLNFLAVMAYAAEYTEQATQTELATYATTGTQTNDDEPSAEEVVDKYPQVRINLKLVDIILQQAKTNHALMGVVVKKLHEKSE